MPTISLRSRRFSSRPVENRHPLLTFYLQGLGFALPFDAVQKVIICDRISRDPARPKVSLTQFCDRDIVIIDVGYRILGEVSSSPILSDKPLFLLIIQNLAGDFIGLPIDAPPIVHRLTDAAFSPIPATDTGGNRWNCLSTQRIQTADQSFFWMMDAEALVNPEILAQLPPPSSPKRTQSF